MDGEGEILWQVKSKGIHGRKWEELALLVLVIFFLPFLLDSFTLWVLRSYFLLLIFLIFFFG